MSRITMVNFIEKHGLTMAARPGPHTRPDWVRGASHWYCTFYKGEKRMGVTFSMGPAHAGRRPEISEVLDCIASDAAGVENAKKDFDEWCREYGFGQFEDDPGRKPLTVFNACMRQTKRLEAFLGTDAYKELLWDTDR